MSDYKIKWEQMQTGATGYSEATYSLSYAEYLANHLNKNNRTGTVHTVVKVDEVQVTAEQPAATPAPAYEPTNWGQPGFAKNRNKRPGGRAR